ncbi:MAG: hypothetical protein Q7T01_01460 [bacterium]|nr:hypothetical protein [bacterium]
MDDRISPDAPSRSEGELWTAVGRVQRACVRRVCAFSHPLLANSQTRWMAVAAGALLAGAWIAALAVPNVPDAASLVTHYTTTFGIDAFGSWHDLARIARTGSAFIAFNIALAFGLTPRNAPAPATASVFLLAAAVLLAFAALVGTVLLWNMNGVGYASARHSEVGRGISHDVGVEKHS